MKKGELSTNPERTEELLDSRQARRTILPVERHAIWVKRRARVRRSLAVIM